jgi:hypothetical protein
MPQAAPMRPSPDPARVLAIAKDGDPDSTRTLMNDFQIDLQFLDLSKDLVFGNMANRR